MKFVMFYHSLISDWNHGNAHFLRGVVSELIEQGHEVVVMEPRDGWSLQNLVSEYGNERIQAFERRFPGLRSQFYDKKTVDLQEVLEGVDVVIVHEWNDADLIASIGRFRSRGGAFRLFFHDTHHRSVSDHDALATFELSGYDGVLAFGEVIRQRYLELGWARRAWTWHEAADLRLFNPQIGVAHEGDLVWIGNWGDGERTAELHEFLLNPVEALALSARVHGVRYPVEALAALASKNIEYRGWLPNEEVPGVFGAYRVTVHVPRRPYVEQLRGVPTIRVFEALACGIPLVCSPWEDVEQLFRSGVDYLIARDGKEMETHLHALLHDEAMAQEMAARGRETIEARHSCAHRVEELLAICKQVGLPVT